MVMCVTRHGGELLWDPIAFHYAARRRRWFMFRLFCYSSYKATTQASSERDIPFGRLMKDPLFKGEKYPPPHDLLHQSLLYNARNVHNLHGLFEKLWIFILTGRMIYCSFLHGRRRAVKAKSFYTEIPKKRESKYCASSSLAAVS